MANTSKWAAHEVLGVPQDATKEQVRAAWRAQARVLHPDRGGSAALFDLSQQAYREMMERSDNPRAGTPSTPNGHGTTRPAPPGGTYSPRGSSRPTPSAPVQVPGTQALWIIHVLIATALTFGALLTRYIAFPERFLGVPKGARMIGGRDSVYYDVPEVSDVPGGLIGIAVIAFILATPAATLWFTRSLRPKFSLIEKAATFFVFASVALAGEFFLHSWRWLLLLAAGFMYAIYFANEPVDADAPPLVLLRTVRRRLQSYRATVVGMVKSRLDDVSDGVRKALRKTWSQMTAAVRRVTPFR
jgi:hypothetical protein